MSAATATVARSGGAATQAIASAENSTLRWLREVVDGNGASPAQMIVTTVLGCIPYVGQALDARNIIIGIIDLSDNPEDGELWLNLVLSLIALVPGFGDALKNVFKLLRLGKPMGRILDALPNQLRGNIEDWFRQLDWAAYTRNLTSLFDNILAKLIGVLDGWTTRAVMGNARVKQVVGQLERIQGLARQKIDETIQSLQKAHQKALADPLPNTTAAAPAAKTPVKKAPPDSDASGKVRTSTGGTYTPVSGQANGTFRQSPPKRDNKSLGASGEHITDYYFVKRNKSRAKINTRGVLYEYQQPGHNGIDHVWHHAGLPFKYRITDTKATGKGRHKLMTPKAAFTALKMGVDIYFGIDDEKRATRAVGTTLDDGVQLSHLWVARKIDNAKLTDAHDDVLSKAIRAWERVKFKPSAETRMEDGKIERVAVKCPYDRSLVTVTGPNLDLHDKSKGGDLPLCSRPVKVHQIAAEFILPTEMLER
jgi:hypothetical protein